MRPLTQNCKYWVFAMQKELDSLVENTFEWQKAPKDKNIVGNSWLYTIKCKRDGSYEYKAQFMAQGYSQIYSEDNRETFAPTTNMASIRWLLQIAVQYDLLIHHMNVNSAYLNAHLDYKIYVEQPEGVEGKNGNYMG